MEDTDERQFHAAAIGGISGAAVIFAVVFLAVGVAISVWAVVLVVGLIVWVTAGARYVQLEIVAARHSGRRPRPVRAFLFYAVHWF